MSASRVARAISAAAVNASIASTELPAEWQAVPSSSWISACSEGFLTPNPSAVRKWAAACSNASAAMAARAARRL